jgi:hypothetical protein
MLASPHGRLVKGEVASPMVAVMDSRKLGSFSANAAMALSTMSAPTVMVKSGSKA